MKKTTLKKLLCATTLVIAGSGLANAQGIIATIAGTGMAGYGGDGGSAAVAMFSSPYGIASDAAGNLYVADKGNNKVRKINAATGIISTFAGSTYGFYGLGGPATAAKMEYPNHVFVNTAGDVLITDWFNDMTFYVDHADGNIYSRLGCGSQGSTGDGGPATAARMMTPTGSCEDLAGNTYIADYGSNRVRRVDAVTGLASTFAGSGVYGYGGDGGPAIAAKFSNPSAVFFEPSASGAGYLYISDANNNVVRRVDLSTNIITTIAGTGVAGYTSTPALGTNALLRNPGCLFIDHDRFLYICDRGNSAIRKMNLNNNIISTIAGTGMAGFSGDGDLSMNAKLNDPEGVCVTSDGYVFIADAGNNRIRMIVPKTVIGASAGTGTLAYGGVASVAFSGSTAYGGFKPSVATSEVSGVEVYPNPSTGYFTISADAANAGASVKVFNVVGQNVFSGTMSGSTAGIDLQGQPSGVYTMIISSAAGTHTEKLAIQ